jgi:hypothetical protein
MAKKYSIIRDELGINNKYGGIYCFMAFDYFDKNKKAVFKIGMTTRPLMKRGDNYHTYFPMGVSTVASLENPTRGVKNFTKLEVRKKHYEAIEIFLMDYIVKRGGYQIISTGKIKDNGRTEWVYTDKKTVDDAFSEAQKNFGGDLENEYDFNHKEYIDEIKAKRNGKHFVGKIIYTLEPPVWIAPKNKKK